MGLADYYRRSAVAISQVLAGFDGDSIREHLSSVRLEIGFDQAAAQSSEGRALLDLLVRIAARLYPSIQIRSAAEDLVHQLRELAREINPAIELQDSRPTVGVWVGEDDSDAQPLDQRIFAGSSEWSGRVSARHPLSVGVSENPIGPGISACLAMANVFRAVFLPADEAALDQDLDLAPMPDAVQLPHLDPALDLGRMVLVGVGAIGNAAAWALSRLPVRAAVDLVDPEVVELGNLQRYVLAKRSDEGRLKVDVAVRSFNGSVRAHANPLDWAAFVEQTGRPLAPALVALDSAAGRRMVQASLPEFIVNGWTQPLDLGISVHFFDGPGACLYCLYLPPGPSPSEDQIYANALGVPDQVMQIRNLLHAKQGAPRELLELIAQRLGVDAQLVLAFEGVELRKLYVEGICGGAILPLGHLGSPRADVHVPLAHQSALAGVMLVAGATRARLMPARDQATEITRLNLMKAIDIRFLVQPAQKDPRGICICQDPDYLKTYKERFHKERRSSRQGARTGPSRKA
jgi:molybdopterin/thiamine biosynthesis adenylyltransferase